jgi:hypothetical protein
VDLRRLAYSVVAATWSAMGLLLIAAPAVHAETESASLGNVSAELNYTSTPAGTYFNVTERIARAGTTLLDQPAGTSSICPDCPPAPASAARRMSVQVVQLDSSPDPEVVFDLYTGGAHCCFYSQIFRYLSGGNSYSGITHDWFDPGYEFQDLSGDGVPEFVSGDGRFAYVFGSFASTRFPPQIWRYDAGVLTDVTRQFPAVISADARHLRRLYRRGHRSPNFQRFQARQVLLTYTADDCLLGKCSKGFRLARHSVKAGEIQRGGRYLRSLRRFLRQTGYT